MPPLPKVGSRFPPPADAACGAAAIQERPAMIKRHIRNAGRIPAPAERAKVFVLVSAGQSSFRPRSSPKGPALTAIQIGAPTGTRILRRQLPCDSDDWEKNSDSEASYGLSRPAPD